MIKYLQCCLKLDKFNNQIIYLHKKQYEISGTIRLIKNLETLYKQAKNNKEISRNSLYNRTAESGLNTEKIEKEELKMSRTQ